MCAHTLDKRPNILLSLLQAKCTRCRRGDMFAVKNPYRLSTTMQMHDRCPVCTQPLNMEPGFYYGTNMVSYALAVLVCIATFFLWWSTIGFSLNDNRFFWWIGINAALLVVLQPPLMRISRSVWLSFFVRYSKDWKEKHVVQAYSVNKEQENNW